MNSKEIKEALEIIKKPITVNCIEYKYFDQENYDKITRVYDNCLWFANNLEQINLTVENLEQEKQELIKYLKEKIKLCKKSQQLALENKMIEQVGNFNLRIATYEEILSKIEKE